MHQRLWSGCTSLSQSDGGTKKVEFPLLFILRFAFEIVTQMLKRILERLIIVLLLSQNLNKQSDFQNNKEID